jgi:glycosyltransferase involved in cell wall biosynthesis
MHALDVFALPSRAEGISNTILEAMASGLPVVATDVGGNAELVAEGETGMLVPAQDPHAMAQALLRYTSDAALRHTHGAAGRSRVERNFSIDNMVERYTRLYQSLL